MASRSTMKIAGPGCMPSPIGSTPRAAPATSGIVACSALKRAYRDVLIGKRRDVRLIYLKGDQDLIARRIAARADHFMPAQLLNSQFAALEEPTPDERPITVSVAPHPREIVETIVADLNIGEASDAAASRW